jgi:hypothetical protein
MQHSTSMLDGLGLRMACPKRNGAGDGNRTRAVSLGS